MDTNFYITRFLENLKSRNNYDLFGSDKYEGIHWGKLFIHLFGENFSRYRIRQAVNNEKLVTSLIQKYSLNQNQILRIDRTKKGEFNQVDNETSEILLILKEGLLFGMINKYIEIFYGANISEKEKSELVNHIELFKTNEKVIRKFHMVQFSRGSFDLLDFDVKPCNIDVNTHYNNDFFGIHDLIINSLRKDKNTKNNGLVLLHGKQGSGKTYYIRHLISQIDRKFIYFPLSMIQTLGSPEFIPFISEQPGSVLILEDCETVLVSRETGHSNASAISNLLNLGDGLLSDALSVNVICTFNSNIKKIDDALLRKGRLLARYEFKELEIDKAQGLANKIGKNVVIDRPMTVSEIYNLEQKSFENRISSIIGFKIV